MDKQVHSATGMFTVGRWTVEPELGRVHSGEAEATLQPQVMQLLLYLAEHAGELVSLDRMIEEVWHGKPMTSGSVYNALNTLRKTLGDRTDEPRYIETIPRRGYRLIAEVQWHHGGDSAEDRDSAENRRQAKFSATVRASSRAVGIDRRIRPILVLIPILSAVLVAWLLGRPILESRPQPAAPPEKSLAVLPFVDMSPDGDQVYFAEGIAEQILHLIARHPDLKVVGRSSSFRFRGSGADLRAIGEQLQVANVLEGSVRRDASRLRITAQLIGTADGYQVWSDTYDADVGDVFRVQDEIARQIAEKLQLSMLGEYAAEVSASSQAPTDTSAHDLYLLARYRVHQGGMENIEEAIAYLEQALEIDPDYAAAHVEMAYALHGLSLAEYGTWYPPPDLRAQIVRHAEIAAALDPYQSGAYAIRATLNYIKAYNGHELPESADTAARQFRRALELNPNDARALLWSAGLHRLQARSYREAVALARRSTELEPLLSHAASYYLSLISDLPGRRIEKWQLIDKISSGATEWEGNADALRAIHYFKEGRLALAFDITSEPGIEPGTDMHFLRVHTLSRLALGAPEAIATAVSEESDALEWSFLGSPMIEVLQPKLGIEVCENLEDISTVDLNACAVFGLRITQYDWVQDLLKKALPENEEDYLLQYRHTFHRADSVALSRATLARLNGDSESLAKNLGMIEATLSSIQGEPPMELNSVNLTRAHIHALKGEGGLAVEAWHRALDSGERMFVHFMHPAFDSIRREPGFVEVLERWIRLINEERNELDLPPLSLNYDAGPGTLPFILAESGPEALGEGYVNWQSRLRVSPHREPIDEHQEKTDGGKPSGGSDAQE